MRSISRRTRATAVAGSVTAALILAGCGTADPKANQSLSTEAPTSSTKSSSQPAPTTSSSTSTSSTSTTRTRTQTPTPTQTPTQTPTPTPTPTQTPTQTPTRTQTEEPTKTQEPKETAKPSPSTSDAPLEDDGSTMALGSSGARVLSAQKRLTSLGYFMPSPDGAYGSGTRQAVWALQKVAGLPRTGNIDAATLKAMNKGVRGNPKISTGLEIDLTKQVMYVVRDGQLIRTVNVSGGSNQSFKYPVKKDGKVVRYETADGRTPTGDWDINFQRDELRESSLEIGNLYRPKYFAGNGIAVHGASSVPAYGASHGCVRVTNTTMDWLWSSGYANLQTRVLVH